MMKMKMNFVSKKETKIFVILFFFFWSLLLFLLQLFQLFLTLIRFIASIPSLIKLDQQNNITYNRGQTVERPEIKHSKHSK